MQLTSREDSGPPTDTRRTTELTIEYVCKEFCSVSREELSMADTLGTLGLRAWLIHARLLISIAVRL